MYKARKSYLNLTWLTPVVALLLTAGAATSAPAQGAECVLVYEAKTGAYMDSACKFKEKGGEYVEILRQDQEVSQGVYCAETELKEEGNYATLGECVKGENPGIPGTWMRIRLPLTCPTMGGVRHDDTQDVTPANSDLVTKYEPTRLIDRIRDGVMGVYSLVVEMHV
jgi:hypothetical protein